MNATLQSASQTNQPLAPGERRKEIVLPARSLPLDDSWEVIVVGGGPSGCAAATAAAREGARTLLLEATASLGGAGTIGLVPAWCPFSDKEKMIYRGLAKKVFDATKQGMAHVANGDLDWVPIDSERLKRVYDDLVTKAGATVKFQTFLSAVETDGNGSVTSIVVTNKRGLLAFHAPVYIDCTGDADLAAWAGAQFQKGDNLGQLQPATHCFILSNVDQARYVNGPDLGWWNPQSPIHQIVASGKYPEIPDKHINSNIVGPNTVGFNAGHVWDVDNTDPDSVSRAVMKGRKIALAYRNALAEFYPEAFGNAFLVATGPTIGIRESRRIVGDYMLTSEDYIARMSFPDEICRNSYFIDLHLTEEEHKTNDELSAAIRFEHYKPGESHGIPYRCLLPRGLRNVIVAGRSISCDRPVQGSVRVMPGCLAMGEAAGVAAVMASRSDHDVHNVNTGVLRSKLKSYGAYIPDQGECGDRKQANAPSLHPAGLS
ncbi:MAG: FAD-dependent oxidoreductase [Chthoniobacteraceae bacterium]